MPSVDQGTGQQSLELGERGVLNTNAALSPVRRKLAKRVYRPEIIASHHDAVLLNRYGSEDEIAEVIQFL